MPVEKNSYRNAMSRLGAAVNVVTTNGVGGRAGFTASAVCSVTDAPPTLLVCANRKNKSYGPLRQNKVLCVNTLGPEHEAIGNRFAGMTEHTMQGRFDGQSWTTLSSGAPVLMDAGVAFDCIVADTVEVGTHSIFICTVEAIHIGREEEGLVYFGRQFHQLKITKTLGPWSVGAVEALPRSASTVAIRSSDQSKFELIRESVKDGVQEMWSVLDAEASRSGTSSERLIACSRALMGVIARHYPHSYIFVKDGPSSGVIDAGLAERFEETARRYKRLLRNIIREGIASGEFRDDINLKIVVNMIAGMLSWTYQWFRPDGTLTGEEISDNMMEVVISGLTPRPKRSIEVTEAKSGDKEK